MGKREGSLDGGGKGEEGVVGGLGVDMGLIGEEGVKADDWSGSSGSSEKEEEGGEDGGDSGHLLL